MMDNNRWSHMSPLDCLILRTKMHLEYTPNSQQTYRTIHQRSNCFLCISSMNYTGFWPTIYLKPMEWAVSWQKPNWQSCSWYRYCLMECYPARQNFLDSTRYESRRLPLKIMRLLETTMQVVMFPEWLGMTDMFIASAHISILTNSTRWKTYSIQN